MRVERDENVWKPIVIVLETRNEADFLYANLNSLDNLNDYIGFRMLAQHLDEVLG